MEGYHLASFGSHELLVKDVNENPTMPNIIIDGKVHVYLDGDVPTERVVSGVLEYTDAVKNGQAIVHAYYGKRGFAFVVNYYHVYVVLDDGVEVFYRGGDWASFERKILEMIG